MTRKRICLAAVSGLLLLAAGTLILTQKNHQYTPIDEWSGSLTTEKVEIAEIQKGYGQEEEFTLLGEREYPSLLTLLGETVKEENSTRKTPEEPEKAEGEPRLILLYDGADWLFFCLENGMVELVFHSEIGPQYGCDGSCLYIDSPDLYDFILNFAERQEK